MAFVRSKKWDGCFYFILAACLALSGCATGRTGTHIAANHEAIAQIKKVGLNVKLERGFAVRIQYISNADTSFLESLLGVGLGAGVQGSRGVSIGGRVIGGGAAVGAGIGAGAGVITAVAGEFSPDKRATRVMKSEAVPLDAAMGSALLDRFQTAGVFPAIELVPSQSLVGAPERGIDTLFVFTVRRWGLRPALGSKYTTGDKALAQLELDVNLQLLSVATGKVLWERDEFYVDSECYSLGDFKSKAGLLASRMGRALQLVCDWTAIEVHPPH